MSSALTATSRDSPTRWATDLLRALPDARASSKRPRKESPRRGARYGASMESSLPTVTAVINRQVRPLTRSAVVDSSAERGMDKLVEHLGVARLSGARKTLPREVQLSSRIGGFEMFRHVRGTSATIKQIAGNRVALDPSSASTARACATSLPPPRARPSPSMAAYCRSGARRCGALPPPDTAAKDH